MHLRVHPLDPSSSEPPDSNRDRFALRPADMPPNTRAALRQAAVRRILSCAGGGLEPLRDATLAHLVTQVRMAADAATAAQGPRLHSPHLHNAAAPPQTLRQFVKTRGREEGEASWGRKLCKSFYSHKGVHARDILLGVQQGPGGDPAAAEVVAQLLADYDRPGAHDFALAWLHGLFAAQPRRPLDSTAAAAAVVAPDDAPGGGQAAGAPGGTNGPASTVSISTMQQHGSGKSAADGTAPSAYEGVLLALMEGLRCCFQCSPPVGCATVRVNLVVFRCVSARNETSPPELLVCLLYLEYRSLLDLEYGSHGHSSSTIPNSLPEALQQVMQCRFTG